MEPFIVGIFGVPNELCAQQYLEAVKTYSNHYQTSAITEIHFIDKDRAMCNLIQKKFEKELVQQGGGRRNRVIASSDMGPGPVANKTSTEESAVRDGKRFRTKEGIDIYVYCAGIGNLEVETLVNAANKDLQHGEGIAYHISNVAGYALEKECDDYIRNNGPIPVGSCCTSTAGKLPYKYIIHAVGPMWHSYKHDRKGECLDDLKSTIMSALKMAAEKGLNSIALPSISSGIFGVPNELCAQQYLEAVKTYSNHYQTSAITEIHFIDKDRAMCNLIQKTFEKELVQQGGGRRNRVNIQKQGSLTFPVVDRKEEDRESGGHVKRQHGFPTPPYWSDMKGEFSSKIKLEEGGYGEEEWQDIKLKIHGSIHHANIVSIHRMQNMFVWEKYWVTKKELETHSGYSNEMLLFHGTTADKLNSITVQNLDPRLAGSSTGALLGKGTYFAVDANYSDHYAKSDQRGHKFMFLVRVLVGKSCRGKPEYLRPPLQDPSDPNNHKLFDSCVDNVENPTIYCVFDRTQYYPEYLIEYL